MKKILYTLIILFTTITFCFSQKTKSNKICNLQNISIDRDIYFDKDNIPTDTIYYLIGKDDRYSELHEYIILTKGNVLDLYIFLKDVKIFLKSEDNGTSSEIEGIRVAVYSLIGMKTIYVYEYNKHKSGYHIFTSHKLNSLLYEIEQYCELNKIKLPKISNK